MIEIIEPVELKDYINKMYESFSEKNTWEIASKLNILFKLIAWYLYDYQISMRQIMNHRE